MAFSGRNLYAGYPALVFIHLLVHLLSSITGISTLVLESGLVGANWNLRLSATTSSAIAMSAYMHGQLERRKVKKSHEEVELQPIMFAVSNRTISLTLSSGDPDISIANSIDHFAQLSLLSPEEYLDSVHGFEQYGGMLIPYAPTIMTFTNCTVQILNSNQARGNLSTSAALKARKLIVAKPETELSKVFELTSSAVNLIPENYRCMILRAEKFSLWDTAMLAWRMRNTRKNLWRYLDEIEKELKLPKSKGSNASPGTLDGLILLSMNDVALNLDNSTLDIKRALAATKSLQTTCKPKAN
ncbi:hypothetical protein V1511DRAFT_476037 [Dipodascopsis uninucleata]